MNKKWLVSSLLILGSALMIISIWGPKSQFGIDTSRSTLASVIEKSGHVTLQNNEMPSAVNLNEKTLLHSRDVVRTDEASDVSIQWTNEAQFRVVEKSEILIDQLENGQPLVIVRTGDLYVEKFGTAPSFWVRKDGQLLSAVDYALADKKNSSHLKEPIPADADHTQLSQFEIETLLNSKKTDFFKCYGQALQKNAQARGSVLLSFTIQKHGQTSKIEVSKSDIADNTFKSCLMEVVARTQFKAFSGAAITTVFPIKFE